MTPKSTAKPHPSAHAWWRFDGKQVGKVKRILPGGSGDLGIVEFDGLVPSAHVATMMQFAAWQPCEPTEPRLEAECTCITLDDGITISDGCLRHSGQDARAADDTAPMLEGS